MVVVEVAVGGDAAVASVAGENSAAASVATFGAAAVGQHSGPGTEDECVVVVAAADAFADVAAVRLVGLAVWKREGDEKQQEQTHHQQ